MAATFLQLKPLMVSCPFSFCMLLDTIWICSACHSGVHLGREMVADPHRRFLRQTQTWSVHEEFGDKNRGAGPGPLAIDTDADTPGRRKSEVNKSNLKKWAAFEQPRPGEPGRQPGYTDVISILHSSMLNAHSIPAFPQCAKC